MTTPGLRNLAADHTRPRHDAGLTTPGVGLPSAPATLPPAR